MTFLLCACRQGEVKWQEQYDLGVRYLSKGNYDEAIIAFTAAIEINPKQVTAYIGRGNAYLSIADNNEENLAVAQADFTKAIELDEVNTEACLGLIEVYLQQDDFENVLITLQSALENASEHQAILDRQTKILELLSQGNPVWMSSEFWFSGEVPKPSDWTVNGKPILSSTYDDFVNAYPVLAETYPRGDIHRRALQTFFNSEETSDYVKFHDASHWKDVPNEWTFQPEIRNIRLNDDINTVLTKLGFSEMGVSLIQDFCQQQYNNQTTQCVHINFKERDDYMLLTAYTLYTRVKFYDRTLEMGGALRKVSN